MQKKVTKKSAKKFIYQSVKELRIDKYLFDKLNERENSKNKFSRSQIQNLIKKEFVKVNGNTVKNNFKLANNVEIEFKENWKDFLFQEIKVPKEEFNFEIVFENDDFLVINKPSNVVIHPDDAGNNQEGTIVNALLSKINLKDFDQKKLVHKNFRPGIVHRLDKETSGLLILAKNQKTQDFFIEQFKKRKIEKEYLSLVKGKLKYHKGIINSPIGRDSNDRKKMAIVDKEKGKEAISKFIIFKEYEIPFQKENKEKKFATLLKIKIETGRTHQIRVHLSAIGHPVIGDYVYGNRNINNYFKTEYDLNHQFLHAAKLKIKTPQGEELNLKANLPKDLQTILTSLE